LFQDQSIPRVNPSYTHLATGSKALACSSKTARNCLGEYSAKALPEKLGQLFPRLRELRQQLREKIGDKFNNISSKLGERCKEVLNIVLDFAEASQRFCSSVLVRAHIEGSTSIGSAQALTRL